MKLEGRIGPEFEREVLRIARLLFPGDPLGGSTIVDGRERDGVFVTEDLVVVIEATTLVTKEKAETDGRKLKALTDELGKKYPYKAIKGYFVTKEEPTAYQRDAIRKIGSPVVAIGYDELRARLINAKEYLDARLNHAFGSARDPETDETLVLDEYQRLDFIDLAERSKRHDVKSVVATMDEGTNTILVGDYGTGKSMTLREAFMDLRKAYFSKVTTRFAIHLNLNDHQGQTEPTEALLRHAQLVGFGAPHQLVRAWRSGDAHIILDGFDEILSSGWSAGSRPIAEVRQRSVELIKRFATETPARAGVLIAGREHFFDSTSEMLGAFGLKNNAIVASAGEFTEEQVQAYLSARSWGSTLPGWLPRRPLLIGYLAGRRLFDAAEDLEAIDVGTGWDRLLDAICAREARTEVGLDGLTVRRMLEKLATLARRSSSGLGPLEFQDLIEAFRDLLGYLPDEGGYGVLQRLPGLRVSDNAKNSRSFVDDDFVDAARAGDVYAVIENPYLAGLVEAFDGAQNLLGMVGTEVLRHKCESLGPVAGALQTALMKTQGHAGSPAIRTELLRIALALGVSPERAIHISDTHLPSLIIGDGADASNVTVSGCLIEVLDLAEMNELANMPYFDKCAISIIDGVAGFDELAGERLQNCDIANFGESTDNMAAILRLELSDRKRVALTVLRKIFVQSGHSRKESALYRGSLTQAQRALIPETLDKLQSRDVIRKIRRRDNILWEPNRVLHGRVKRILDSPTMSSDEIIVGF